MSRMKAYTDLIATLLVLDIPLKEIVDVLSRYNFINKEKYLTIKKTSLGISQDISDDNLIELKKLSVQKNAIALQKATLEVVVKSIGFVIMKKQVEVAINEFIPIIDTSFENMFRSSMNIDLLKNHQLIILKDQKIIYEDDGKYYLKNPLTKEEYYKKEFLLNEASYKMNYIFDVCYDLLSNAIKDPHNQEIKEQIKKYLVLFKIYIHKFLYYLIEIEAMKNELKKDKKENWGLQEYINETTVLIRYNELVHESLKILNF